MPAVMRMALGAGRVSQRGAAILALALAMLLPACSSRDKEAERGNDTTAAADTNAPPVAVAADPGTPPIAILPPKPGLPAVAVVPPAKPGAPPALAVIPPDPNAPPVAVVPPPDGEVRVVIPVAADSVAALPDCSSSVETHCVLNRKTPGPQKTEPQPQ